ncbi:MAG: BamA/TamA family outer membrane protein, partial [Phaeodactylibacter sp.]|nr:BamA/TamA family outer membrane protein [Phaeodactylibacter sp.]
VFEMLILESCVVMYLMPRHRPFFLLLFPLTLLLGGCNTYKYLDQEKDQAYLIENEIQLKSELKIKKKGNLKYELTTLYKQKPNERFLFFIPRQWFYYNVQDTIGKSDFTKGWKRWQMKQFGEEPSIFNRSQMEASERNMKYYLQHKGYFEADVEAFVEYQGKSDQKIKVIYQVSPGRQLLIDTLVIKSQDTVIRKLVEGFSENSILAPGTPVAAQSYEQEVRRLTRLLRNEGYAYFQPQYFSELVGDSLGNGGVRLEMEILNPPGRKTHPTYRVGNIYIHPNYDPSSPNFPPLDTISKGIFFYSDTLPYTVTPKTLTDKIFLRKDSLYRQLDYDRTNQQLSNLGIFQYVTIKEERDPNNEFQLNFKIFLTPNKRFEFGLDGEVNTSNSPFVGAQLVGISGKTSLRHRNLFKGAELFVGNGEIGFDFDPLAIGKNDPDRPLFRTWDIALQTDLYFPKFVDYFSIWRTLTKVKLMKSAFFAEVEEKASTRLTLSYNYLKNINFYTINSFNAAFGYDFRLANRARYQVNHFAIDFFNPIPFDAFNELLKNNPSLARSFDKQFFTGFLFRNINFNYSTRPNLYGESYSAGLTFEISGLEVQAANSLYNALASNPRNFEFNLSNGETIELSKYMRFESDLRAYRSLNEKESFAFRFYTGLAFPYGSSTEVPYVQQFFVGGPQSIRAWSAREIGPGGHRDSLTIGPDANPTVFYQTGDFKFEVNAEYRFHLFSFFGVKYDGAIFLDAGNVYTLSADSSRALTQLLWTPKYERIGDREVKVGDNLFKYLAIGTGFGLRVDFSYFIFRLDIGLKLRNPYPTLALEPGTDGAPPRYREIYWRDLSPFFGADHLNFNIGLGYPF